MDDSVTQRRQAIARRHPVWVEMTLDAYLDRAAEDYGARDLVVTDDLTLSYDDVIAQSARIVGVLLELGVEPGDRVGMLIANYPIAAPLLFAIWRLGAIAVPINTLYRADELSFVIGQSACKVLVTMGEFLGRSFIGSVEQIEPRWREGIFQSLPDLKAILIYGAGPDDPHDLEARMASHAGVRLPGRAMPGDPAVIMYTSGTTGFPKGVVQTHDGLLRASYALAYHQAHEDGRRAVFSVPLYHAFGLVVGLLAGLIVGGAIIPLTRFDPVKMLRAIGIHRANYLMGVPTMTLAMLEELKRDRAAYDLSSLTAIHSAAAPTPSWVWKTIQETFGCQEIVTSYGQTETTATIICTQPGDDIETVATTQGTATLAGVAGIPELGGRIAAFKTIDPETGADLPPGATGEICTRGPLNSLGYFRRPDETAKVFLDGGWIRTGDLGRFRVEDGYLYLTGRSKELYKSRGELVAPKELELLLTSHPAISQAFFIGMPDDRWGECGCAWVVPSGAAPISEEDVLAFLKTRVPSYKLPRDVWFIEAEALPKTGTGKVQKAQLQAMARERLAVASASDR